MDAPQQYPQGSQFPRSPRGPQPAQQGAAPQQPAGPAPQPAGRPDQQPRSESAGQASQQFTPRQRQPGPPYGQPGPGFGAPSAHPPFNPPSPGFYPQPGRQPFIKRSANGFAIAGLIVSLLATAVVLSRFSQFLSPFGVIGLILSVLGYAVNRDEEGVTTSRTARIFAIVGGILSLVAILVTLFTGIFDPNASYHSLFRW